MAIIKVSNVSKSFLDNKSALKNVSFQVEEGEFVVIAGQNGSGKSVLMSLIAKLDNPTSGSIEAPKVGLVFQDADAQILGETPEEDIAFGLKNLKYPKAQIEEKVTLCLHKVHLIEKRNHQARSLSGGEKRRLSIAGILAMDRNTIILDEPFANLDWFSVLHVCNMLLELKNEGKTIIVLTHEIEKILGIADRFIILDKGEIKYDGDVKGGLTESIQDYGIRYPLLKYEEVKDLFWGSK